MCVFSVASSSGFFFWNNWRIGFWHKFCHYLSGDDCHPFVCFCSGDSGRLGVSSLEMNHACWRRGLAVKKKKNTRPVALSSPASAFSSRCELACTGHLNWKEPLGTFLNCAAPWLVEMLQNQPGIKQSDKSCLLNVDLNSSLLFISILRSTISLWSSARN